jgi:hypothetical protein
VFLFAAMTSYAQLGDFTFDGFVRTGFVWTKEEKPNTYPKVKVRLGSLDDAGDSQGRIRLNFTYAINNVGVKGRIQWDDWAHEKKGPDWSYLFGYVNSFEDQLTISMGKLGASPWSTGGPEKWKELESSDKGGGMRVEYKPVFLPGLNAGFVLNWFNGGMDQGSDRDVTLLDVLQESVFGIAYENDYFLARFAYRLDSDYDTRSASGAAKPGTTQGDDLIYRLEERVLKNYLPGFKIWAIGEWQGIGKDVDEGWIRYENWLFMEYAPDWCTAQLRLGYDVIEKASVIHIKPSYYHNFLDGRLEIGASFLYKNDFGEYRVNKEAPYREIEIEPKIQFNFANAYVAFIYRFNQEYLGEEWKAVANPPINRTQTMNLRFGMTF